MELMSRSRNRVIVAATAAVSTLVLVAGTASATAKAPAVVSPPIVEGLAGPLQFEVGDNGHVLVAQSFSGTVSAVNRKGEIKDLFNDPGVDGVAAGPWGSVLYTHTDQEGGAAELRLRTKEGRRLGPQQQRSGRNPRLPAINAVANRSCRPIRASFPTRGASTAIRTP